MKKQWNALLLAILLVGGTVIGCSNNETPTNTDNGSAISSTAETDGEQAEENESEWKMFENLPEEDFNGRTYTILARMENESQFVSYEMTGESVNDSIYERNLAVMDRYNITIEVPTIDGSWGNNVNYTASIRASIQSGDGAYDLIDGYAAVVGTLVMDGCYYRLNDIEYIEPSAKWWSISAVEDLSINGNVYLTPGDISMSLYDNIFAFFFNQNMFEEFGLDDVYALVNNGTWTYDTFLKICTAVSIDADGNGTYNENDIYGVVFSDDLEFNNFHYAFQIPITVKDADGYPVFNLGSESVANLVDTMKTLAYSTNGVYYYKGNDSGKLNMFLAGQAAIMPNLLSATVSLRDMEDNFGILPYPKYDESQAGYYTTSRDNSILFGIPIDVKDANFAGLISEALCQASYQMVKPVYYENVLKTKLARDAESQEMIDILRDGLVFDIGAVYALQLERAGFLVRDCVYYQYEYASHYKANENKYNQALEDFIAHFKD